MALTFRVGLYISKNFTGEKKKKSPSQQCPEGCILVDSRSSQVDNQDWPSWGLSQGMRAVSVNFKKRTDSAKERSLAHILRPNSDLQSPTLEESRFASS